MLKPVTKRFMELFVVLAVIAAIWAWRQRENHTDELLDKMNGITRVMNQTLWDRHGPGAMEPYLELFPSSGSSEQMEEPAFDALEYVQLIGMEQGFTGVDEAPDWFHQLLGEGEGLHARLREALSAGPYLAAPDEEWFSDPERPIPNLLKNQQTVKLMGMLAKRAWIRGEHEQAVQYLMDNIRLGEAYHADPYLISHLIRVALHGITMHAFGTLVWTDPGAEANRMVLEALNTIDPSKWEMPRYTENFLWMPGLAHTLSEGSNISPETFGYLYILLTRESDRYAGSGPQRNPEFVDWMHRAGLLPERNLSAYEASSWLRQWTALPALRKRASTIPAAVYESDPFFSPEEARKIPPLIYVIARYMEKNPFSNNINADIRFKNARATAELTKAAYWVRDYRSKNGRFPVPNEFASEFNSSESIMLAAVNNPAPLIADFIRIHGKPQEEQQAAYYNYLGDDSPQVDANQSNRLLYPLNWPPNETYNYEYHRINVQRREIKRQDLVDWTRGVLEACDPFVRSATVSKYYYFPGMNQVPASIRTNHGFGVMGGMGGYGMGMGGYGMGVGMYGMGEDREKYMHPPTYEEAVKNGYPAQLSVELNLPRTSYWVVHPGPDEVWGGPKGGNVHGPLLRYDPSNGLMSDGDLIQLAGWE